MSNVSHSFIISQLALVPRRPIAPVTPGRSSGSAALPRSALATPAPRVSATCSTSSAACMAPAPTSIATFLPSLSTSAARCRSGSYGTTLGLDQPALEWTVLCVSMGGATGSSWRSLGTITQVTQRSASAMRKARSIACRIAVTFMTVVT